MPFGDWITAIAPKVQGTWNLHEALAGLPLDFFLLFSSAGGIIGQQGQSNYSAANTFLDAFVQFRRRQGLTAWSIDLGPVDDVGYVSERSDLLYRFKNTHHHTICEQDVLDGLELAIKNSIPNPKKVDDNINPYDGYVCQEQMVLGLLSTLSLSDENNRTIWRHDPRFSWFDNQSASYRTETTDTSGIRGDGDNELKNFLATVELNPRLLAEDTSVTTLAHHIGAALCSFIMKSDELDLTADFDSLGLDSLVAIEMRNWARQHLGLNVSVLEILRAGNIMTLAALGVKKLVNKYGETGN